MKSDKKRGKGKAKNLSTNAKGAKNLIKNNVTQSGEKFGILH